MAGWLHGVFVGDWLFVSPLCGFSLPLFCNHFKLKAVWALRVASLQNVCLAHACLAVGGDSPLRPIETVRTELSVMICMHCQPLHSLQICACIADLWMHLVFLVQGQRVTSE